MARKKRDKKVIRRGDVCKVHCQLSYFMEVGRVVRWGGGTGRGEGRKEGGGRS